jgi:hypothetical protein
MDYQEFINLWLEALRQARFPGLFSCIPVKPSMSIPWIAPIGAISDGRRRPKPRLST